MAGDFYETLGVSRDADLSAIKKAYRQVAMRYHPDKNPGDQEAEEKFKRAAEAYAVLSDPEKRRRYDQFGEAGVGGQGFGGFDREIFADFGDILGDLFGFGDLFGGRGRGRRRGRDLRFDLEIDLEQAVRGHETTIRIPRMENCGTCDGSGAREGGVESCRQCDGRGKVAFQQGFFTIARPCSECRGAGRRITDPCPDCRGEGRLRNESELQLKVPPGVEDGVSLRMTGHGEAGGPGAPPGDLYIAIHVREHEFFQRQGRQLHCAIPVSFAQAALGTEIAVPTLDGEETIRVPAGTQTGEVFRVKGAGAPGLQGGGRGDLHVTVVVRTPTRLSTEQRELLERLAEISGEESGDERGLFDRVKDMLR